MNDNLCISTLRCLALDMIDKANSGHPGMALGSAPILHTLYSRHLVSTAADSGWIKRDRFVLSSGHVSSLLYAMLHLTGYDISLDDLKSFRQFGSKTPGHPEFKVTDGVDISTGPLGQGIANAVGMAMAEAHLVGANPNLKDVLSHYTYALCGDGDLQEGIAAEAMSLAGHLALKKLIVLYDSNDIQLDGEVHAANTENTKEKVESMGWNYLLVEDGSDCDQVDVAIENAKKSAKPTLVEIKTIIGHGAPNCGESSVHGKPMTTDEIAQLRKNLEYDTAPFEIKDSVYLYYKKNVIERGEAVNAEWNSLLSQYETKYPTEYQELLRFIDNDFTLSDLEGLPQYAPGSKESTRKVMGKFIDWLGIKLPNIMGGSADLSSSTMVKGADGVFSPSNPLGRHIKFGVREHAMAAITNGITVHGGIKGYCAGFFVFSDYMKPAIRVASIMNLPSLFFFSHDTVCVGEDGPTHQPIEQLTMFRSMPNTNVFRPADACEMTAALLHAFAEEKCPTVIVSTRQVVPNLVETSAEGVSKGAYIAFEPCYAPEAIIITCGSELHLSLNVAKKLEAEGVYVRVVSMPSMYLFEKQSKEYKEEILPSTITKRLAVEMGASMPWYKYASNVHGIDTFGASMPIDQIYGTYGFTEEVIYK